MKENYIQALSEIMDEGEFPGLFKAIQENYDKLQKTDPEEAQRFIQSMQKYYEIEAKKQRLYEIKESYLARIERLIDERKQKLEWAKQEYSNKVRWILKNPIQAIFAPVDYSERKEEINNWYLESTEKEKRKVNEILQKEWENPLS